MPRDNALKRHAPHKPSDANETSALLVKIRIRNRQTRFVFQKAAVGRLPSEHLFFEKPSPWWRRNRSTEPIGTKTAERL
jgi:hypothetical protein